MKLLIWPQYTVGPQNVEGYCEGCGADVCFQA